MCGILGTVNKEFNESVLDLIKHRGPDDSGIERISLHNNIITFGHRRLSIQDLSIAGHQPMYSDCKKYIIIFNGEIYNHLNLRSKLQGVSFKGHSDTETIVNYISKFGIESIADFNGIFGLCILDITKQMLYLARDRYGVKPIYWYELDKGIIFSSEIRPIKKLVSTDINNKNLATLLKLRYNPAPTTLYTGIKKLRPGHILEYNIKKKTLREYPFLNKKTYATQSLSFNEALLEYGRLFEQTIKRQLLADVEVGVLLSGGIDSALVAYYAQKYSDKQIKTFTIGFNENDESDETLDAKETARILGTEHYEIKIDDKQFESSFQKCIEIVEEPLGTTSIIPMYFLNNLVAKHKIKVVLTGQGADEPLGGYTRYQGEILHKKFPSIFFQMLKPLSGFIRNESIFRAINSLGEKNTTKRWELIYSLFREHEIINLVNTEETQSLQLINYFYELLDGNSRNSTDAMMSNDLRMNLADDLLLYTDKISMHYAIETRVPMLDNELVDFIESLPLNYKIHGKEGKYIHKKFAETVLPKEIIYRKKKGFKSPTEKWFKGEKGAGYKTMLTADNSEFSKLFDVKEVEKIFDTHISGKRNMEKQLFTLISIYYWLKNK